MGLGNRDHFSLFTLHFSLNYPGVSKEWRLAETNDWRAQGSCIGEATINEGKTKPTEDCRLPNADWSWAARDLKVGAIQFAWLEKPVFCAHVSGRLATPDWKLPTEDCGLKTVDWRLWTEDCLMPTQYFLPYTHNMWPWSHSPFCSIRI